MEKQSNYEIFKQDALKRFLTFDQETIISRLSLCSDDTYIYLSFCSSDYRIHRTLPSMERKSSDASGNIIWEDTDSNEVLSICDLLCHTTEKIHLSGTYTTLEGLSRLQSGSVNTLGRGFFHNVATYYDGNIALFRSACEKLNGNPTGKGDVAYQIPLFGEICLRFQFYQSDDEFDASLTIFFDVDICKYLHYETLYYITGLVFDKLKKLSVLP